MSLFSREVLLLVLLPFVGTTLGAACVFGMRTAIGLLWRKTLLGFASGVMTAASVWSLLLPAIDGSAPLGRMAFVPAVVGLMLGFSFLLVLDVATPHLHVEASEPEGPSAGLKRTTMLCLAVTLHNIPEGMAVGVVCAGLSGSCGIGMAEAMALSIGIAIQNFPEGAIVSMPLAGEGNGRMRSFVLGTLSGVVEPLAAVVTLLLASVVRPVMPYLLSFAAGAMLYVVVEELIPEASEGGGRHSNLGTIGFAVGFALMMSLDVALG